MNKILNLTLPLAGLALAMVLLVTTVFAAHNGANVVVSEPVACEVTTFTAGVVDPLGTHKVANMRLVVDDGDTVQSTDVIPTDGTTVFLEVGPFAVDTTVSWRVFGGGERNYDRPSWNGFGEPDFTAEINAYAALVDGFAWVLSGTDDPNPFTNWNEEVVPGCYPTDKDQCKNGGWQNFGFRNQGLCIQFANTGKDSR